MNLDKSLFFMTGVKKTMAGSNAYNKGLQMGFLIPKLRISECKNYVLLVTTARKLL